MNDTFLSDRDRKALLALAEVALPPGDVLRGPDASSVRATEATLAALGPSVRDAYKTALRALEYGAIARTGSRLSALPRDARWRCLAAMHASDATSWLVRLVTAPLKLVAGRDPALTRALKVEPKSLPVVEEIPRWRSQILDARELTSDESLEVDAVVIGTGAGGAPLARNLAARGHAVVMLEEGGYFSRRDFHGDLLTRQQKLYRDGGLTASVGNTFIPIPVGRSVGGTTTVNSGTCYRTPDDVLRRWAVADGLTGLSPDAMARHFERVEAMLNVSVPTASALGGCAAKIALGCDALGYRHNALHRNAVGCDGQGECCFGCPTDAKRSTNVSYVPAALQSGAVVYTHARADEVILERGRAVGVRATSLRSDGSRVRLTVRAKAVVLSAGTLHTPTLLLAQGIANTSGQVGRNLSLHPASQSWALFDDDIRGWEAIPQGWAIEHFEDEGIRFEGVFLPPDLTASTLGVIGPRWTEMVERMDRLACFGFMVCDTSRGRVYAGTDGRPQVRYWLNDHDRRRILRAHALLARVWLAAGARKVLPGLQRFEELRDESDVLRLEAEGPSSLSAHHIDLSAYHPLGTCRMGVDPRVSVVSPSHESFDVEGLFVCDGSAVPSALGVNPQVTIMALSERASGFVERRIEAASAREKPLPRREIAFSETMAGECTLRDGSPARASFQIRAEADPTQALTAPKGDAVTFTWALTGRVTVEGLCEGRDAVGSLSLRLFRRDAALCYKLAFTDEHGGALTLVGEKNLGWNPLRGMTTLHTRVLSSEGEVPLAEGVLRFDLATLGPWLKTWSFA